MSRPAGAREGSLDAPLKDADKRGLDKGRGPTAPPRSVLPKALSRTA